MSGAVQTKGDVAMGKLIAQMPAAEGQPPMIQLAIPGTSYQLHLVEASPVQPDGFKQVRGRIVGRAKRVDVVRTGGRFVEPVYGRPRRVQGRITHRDLNHNRLTVFCGVPMVFDLLPSQKVTDFADGQMVGFDVERGTCFEPAP